VPTLFGSYDENLKHFESVLGVRIRTQGNELVVDGEKDNLGRLEREFWESFGSRYGRTGRPADSYYGWKLAALGVHARARIEEHFEIGKIVRQYESLYDEPRNAP